MVFTVSCSPAHHVAFALPDSLAVIRTDAMVPIVDEWIDRAGLCPLMQGF